VVALLHRGDAGTDIDHDSGALVTEDRREETFRIGAGQREFVGVANPGRLDLEEHLERLRALELHRHDLERLARGHRHRGFHIHLPLLNCGGDHRHDPEKWTPVFGKDHASSNNQRLIACATKNAVNVAACVDRVGRKGLSCTS